MTETTQPTRSFEPQFIRPIARQFPFDEVCSWIVDALEARNWDVPGFSVKFDVYGSGAQKMRMVREIAGPDCRIYFSRKQRTLPGGRWNDTAAVNSITRPYQSLTVYEDESGPTFSIYVGDRWEEDRDWFMRSGYDVNPKLYKERRRNLEYKGSWKRPQDDGYDYHYQHTRSPYLIHNTDLGRAYSPVPVKMVPAWPYKSTKKRRKVKKYEKAFGYREVQTPGLAAPEIRAYHWSLAPAEHPAPRTTDAPLYFHTGRIMQDFAVWLTGHVLGKILETPEAEVRLDFPAEPFVPMPEGCPPIFTFGAYEHERRIRLGQTDPESKDIHPADFYGMACDWNNSGRLLTEGTGGDESLKQATDGFMWCGFGEVTPETPIESLEVPGFYRWSDRMRFVLRLTPKSAHGIYVADWGAYESARDATFDAHEEGYHASNVELAEWQRAAARTLVPLAEYCGGYSQPVVLFECGRELGFDEVEIVSGPWPGRQGRV